MISVVTWRWGNLFSPEFVATLRSMLARHLHLPHQLYCITDQPADVPGGVIAVPMPTGHASTPRCRRRMWQFARERAEIFGPRMLCMDLDVVIVDDITPLVDRPEPTVLWRVGYAGVYSGSFMLFDTGALHGAWVAFREDPDGYPLSTGEKYASDQAMLNHYLRGKSVAHWTEADGVRTYFGKGYESKAHHGIGPDSQHLPPGTRIVVLGSADKHVLEQRMQPWIARHWC